MKNRIVQWFHRQVEKTVNSIAFYPAFMALLFLGLSYLMVHLDFSETGKAIKSQMEWLRLKDASTARTTISVIAAGILSLTVFTFTMVMVVLNQAASQLSNRVLDNLIGNRFQQSVLGIYIGTIVYSMFLLSTIRDVNSGIYVPSLSTYLLIALAIVDIFIFIYFLHYVTQSVKYAVIINRIQKQTQQSMSEACRLSERPDEIEPEEGIAVAAPASGIFNGFNRGGLLDLAKKMDCRFNMASPRGSFVLKNTPIVFVSHEKQPIEDDMQEKIAACITINQEETVDSNFNYGFRQLTEVALKALSPGVNDPGTAVQSLRALAELLAYRLHHYPDNIIKDEEGTIRLLTREYSFEYIFNSALMPIWDYGRNDRFIQEELHHLLEQLYWQRKDSAILKLWNQVKQKRSESEATPVTP